MDAAVAGRPQVVNDHFEPDEKGDATLDAALREARGVIGRMFAPRPTAVDEVLDGAAGHGRVESPAKRK